MSLTSFLSSFLPVAYADAPAKEEKEEPAESKEEESSGDGEGEEGGEPEAAEEEEEEPEDEMPALREECQNTTKCAPFAKHFAHCQEKVEGGEGYKGEDCVEEMFHMMHCVDDCVAPKLFAKLR